MDFEVLIHMDRILDYSTPPNSPSGHSYDSGTGGIPDDQLEPEYPIRYPFVWRLGEEDGARPRGGVGRVTVHDRLGG
jgi:hypothetical protein